ncbi:MAG: ATP/GTP-binding protein [Archaeoglobales archaeon]|nr:ATP/GTP-binding protein [Archaeoglobales archaeon]
MKIFVTGPAGSGKSTFVKNFSEFLEQKGYDVLCVNLDPATDPVFKTSANIRDFLKTEEVMKSYDLGINGALLKSIELAEKIIEKFNLSADFVIYDTPGQMELFIYSESGRRIVKFLSDSFTCSLFLIDSNLAKDPEGFMAAIFQNLVVSLRLSLPTLTVFTKSDLINFEFSKVMEEIESCQGLLAEILERLNIVGYTSIRQRMIKVSNVTKDGFEDLFDALNELFCACGDIS